MDDLTLLEYVAIRIWEQATPLKPGPWNDSLQLWERADERDKRIALLQAKVAIDAVLAVTPVVISQGK